MKVLLVEDDRKIATAIKRGLEGEGFTVEASLDGAEGLWLATEGSYDLIILDIMLPGRNGYQICADLRTAGDWTPILMLTAKDGDLDEAEALETGADDYLTKPFSFPVLVARIRALLRRATGRSPIPVEVGDLRIDPGQRRAWRAGVEVKPDFAPVRRSRVSPEDGRVRSSPRPKSSTGFGNTISQATPTSSRSTFGVFGARIDEPFGRRTIETVRGSGYRLATNGK